LNAGAKGSCFDLSRLNHQRIFLNLASFRAQWGV